MTDELSVRYSLNNPELAFFKIPSKAVEWLGIKTGIYRTTERLFRNRVIFDENIWNIC